MSVEGLIVFDVDGTLLRGKTICELIAARIGKSEQMAWLEQNDASAYGDVDALNSAREEMATWYFAAGRTATDRFMLDVTWAPGAKDGVHRLQEHGWLVALASITWRFAVERIAEELAVSEVIATDLDWESGSIEHVYPETKAEYLSQLIRRFEVPQNKLFAVGDSRGDLPLLERAGRGVFVGDNDPKLSGVTHWPDAGIDGIADLVLASE